MSKYFKNIKNKKLENTKKQWLFWITSQMYSYYQKSNRNLREAKATTAQNGVRGQFWGETRRKSGILIESERTRDQGGRWHQGMWKKNGGWKWDKVIIFAWKHAKNPWLFPWAGRFLKENLSLPEGSLFKTGQLMRKSHGLVFCIFHEKLWFMNHFCIF